MQLLGDFYFFGCVVVASVPAVILGIKEKPIKYYGMIATLFFIWMAMGSNLEAVIYLGAYCAIEYILTITYIKIRAKFGRREWIYLIYLLLSISPLVISKVSGFVDMHIFGFLGISYMTFKSVQIIIEIYDGIIKEINTFDFLYLLLFFPTVTSGPIDRSRRFSQDADNIIPKDEYLEMVGNGILKILIGMVYKFVFASVFYQSMVWLGMKLTMTSCFIYMYSYGFYLFFDFAGYSLMAVGLSYIFGIKTPDNFNKPFISKDIKEFWDRWHITLSHWFRDFLFSRIVMRFIKKGRFKNKLTRASVAFIINMTIMGIWHGLDLHYILYGVYHGVLLALTEIYQKKSKFHKKHKKEKWYMFISWFITFNLVMFGFFIFSGRFTLLAEELIRYVLA